MYTIEEENGKVIVGGMKDFNLDHILDCGQCFRWTKQPDGSYFGIAFEKALNVSFVSEQPEGLEGKLILDGSTISEYETIWKPYFDLERDYGKIKEVFRTKDAIMAKAIPYGEGIRILQQEKWETLVSFLISQNNNIPRIKKCIENICTTYGEKLENTHGKECFSFPRPEVMERLTQEDLDCCKLGYRARYIIETAKMVVADGGGSLNSMGAATKEETMEYLLGLCGVGPKVANCIMLFSMGKYDSFPLDVWVKRVMHQLYGIEEQNIAEMQRYAKEHFGEYGGIAQQYLFHYIRQTSKFE